MTGEKTTTLLSEWLRLIDHFLTKEQYKDALAPIRLILGHRPRHLATYERLLHVAWQLQLWDEGTSWGGRLLAADPGNALAWRSLAMGMEQNGNRAKAHAVWQRAFEASPYDPHVRAGLNRTTLHGLNPLALNHACLATLHLRNGRWKQASQTLEMILSAPVSAPVSVPVDNRKSHLSLAQINDFQVGLMVSQWQLGKRKQAYRLARQLVQQERNLILPWYVLNDLGDANDKALAYNPLQIMDPDGEYLRTQFGIDIGPRFIEIEVTTSEVELLGVMG